MSISVVNTGKTQEYKDLENKISALDAKITSMYNRIQAKSWLSFASTFYTVALLSATIVVVTGFVLVGTPIFTTYLERTIMMETGFIIAAIVAFVAAVLHIREVNKNNPI